MRLKKSPEMKYPNYGPEVPLEGNLHDGYGMELTSAAPPKAPLEAPTVPSPLKSGFPWVPVIIGGGTVAVLACLCLIAVGVSLFFLTSQIPPTLVTGPGRGLSNAYLGREVETLNLRGDEPITLDPALASDVASAEYIEKIFSGLVTLNKDLEVVPDIAKDWDVEDGTVYTFYLREDVVFHDGKPVTAEDFKYSIERACDPETGSTVARSYLGDIVGAQDKLNGEADEVEGVEVIDDYTLRITIDAPKAYFLSKLTSHTAFIVDWENIEEGGEDWTEQPNGTGPFKLAEVTDERIILVANELYYGGAPAIKRVSFIIDGGDPMTMYEQGELDAVFVGPINIERVLDPTNPLHEELTIVPSLDVWYLAFNTTMEPFDDIKIRQAFAHATNKRGIVNVLLQKTVTEAKGILPPSMPGYNEDLEGLPYDPDRARELIAESSYGDAAELLPITFSVSGQGETDPLAEALVEMYSEILGVEIEIQQTGFGAFLDDLEKGRYQMFMLGWVADYPDPENFLDIHFHSESEYNQSGYANPEVDTLLQKARLEEDGEERMRLYQEAEKIIVEDVPWIPIYHGVNYVLIKPYVKGLAVTPQSTYYLKDAYLERTK